MTFYKGFSTIDRDNKWKVDDGELVKRDILNQFNTRRGERVMNPNFGSVIWELVFDGMTTELREAIINDATRIVNADPRVSLREVNITEFEHGFQIDMDLYYITLDQSETMFIQFNNRTNELTSI